MPHRRTLLVGWDAADWRVASPLVDAGRLPNLQRLIEGGVLGDLGTLSPVVPSLVWTSLATGVRPSRHGVLTDNDIDACGVIQPVGAGAVRAPRVWDLLAGAGVTCAVVGWPATAPAAVSDAICVSDRFAYAGADGFDVSPPRLAAALAPLRMQVADLDAGLLAAFVPDLRAAAAARDARLVRLAGVIAAWASVHNAATWILEHEQPDFLAVRYGALAALSDLFMAFHPPRRDGIGERDFTLYSGVVAAAYHYHDLMLGRLIELAGPETTVIVASAYGYHSDDRRPAPGTAGGAASRRRYGMLCASGPGIPADQRLYGMNILDVAPTLLALHGYAAPAMDGRPRTDLVTGPLRPLPASPDGPATDADDDRPAAARSLAGQALLRQRSYNLAVSEIEAGRVLQGAALLDGLVRDDAGDHDALLLLGRCELLLGRHAACRAHLDTLQARWPDDAQAALLAGGLAVAEGRAEDAAACFARTESVPLLDARTLRDLAIGYARLGEYDKAEDGFRRALAVDPDDAGAHDGLAVVLLQTARPAEAADAALRAIGLDYQMARAHFHLGVALTRCGWARRAAEAFEACVALRPDAAVAHDWLAHLFGTTLCDESRSAYHRALARRGIAVRSA